MVISCKFLEQKLVRDYKNRGLQVGWTGAVVSVVDYGPRGHRFETWQRHSLLWP